MNYYDFKKRLAGTNADDGAAPSPDFVEVVPPRSSIECTVAVDGRKLRVYVKGTQVPGLAALPKSLLDQS